MSGGGSARMLALIDRSSRAAGEEKIDGLSRITNPCVRYASFTYLPRSDPEQLGGSGSLGRAYGFGDFDVLAAM